MRQWYLLGVMIVILCIAYFFVLALLSTYGLHRLHLVMLCRRHKEKIAAVAELAERRAPAAGISGVSELGPKVTIQLPIFNESTVIVRLLEQVARMDYPQDLLEIQVLDDSIDETQGIARAAVDRLKARGIDAVYIHRTDRTGYKAGALENGMKVAKGELIAVFDADFLPRTDFVRELVGHFADPKVAMVQTRWAHMNRDVSFLTRVQALMLDGHHMVENRARYGAGLLFNFSGTGGMWRKIAITDAGGWQHDTITEDLDLSYRAQLRGWRFIYRPDVVSPAELPEDISALRAQQYRWAKGTVQTARKLLGRVLRADLTRAQRVEAFFHLTPHFAYPLMVALCLLLLPVLLNVAAADVQTMLLFDLPLCMAPMSSLIAFYMLAETAQGRSRWGAIKLLPGLIALGAGLAPHLTRAVVDGWRNSAGEFVRTPKHGTDRWRYRVAFDMPWLEIGCAGVSVCSVIASVTHGHYFAAPFALLFACGYGYISQQLISERIQLVRRARATAVDPVLDVPQPEPSFTGEPAAAKSRLAA